MTLKLGAYTACLHDRPLEAALEVLGSNGLTSVEVNTGGFIPSPHCHVDLLLSSAQARRDYLEVFASRGMELTGLNCNGNPLNPLPGVGPKHADDLRRTIELAGLLGVPNVVTMSGVLDTSFERVPADAEGRVPTGYGFWCSAWPNDPAWRFVAVGIGHDVPYWTGFLSALAEIDPDMAVNIEHEDASYSRLDGLALAAGNLRAAAAKM